MLRKPHQPPRSEARHPCRRGVPSLLVWLACVLVLTTLAAGCRRQSRANAPLTVGAVLPLTGAIAEYGTDMRRGMELALADSVASGSLREGQVRLVFENGEANPAKSVVAYEKLIAIDRPIAVVPATSGVILAIKPLANRDQVVILNASAVSPSIEDADDYSFSVLPNAEVEGGFLADAAFARGRRAAGILFRNDPSGLAFRDAFRKAFQAKGGKVVLDEGHQPGERDFRPYVTRVARMVGLDSLFVASFGPEVAAYVRQAAEMGVTRETYAYTTFNSPKALELAGVAANGVLFSSPQYDPTRSSPAVDELRQKLLRRYGGGSPNYYVAAHYDALALVLQGIAQGRRDGPALRAYLAGLSEYHGKSGVIRFGKFGSASIPLDMYSVQAGRVVALH